jgi:hypothetical protein
LLSVAGDHGPYSSFTQAASPQMAVAASQHPGPSPLNITKPVADCAVERAGIIFISHLFMI